MAILTAEWRGVLERTWNYNSHLVFAHIVLANTLGARRDKDILARITRRMELWDRGIHTGLVGDADAEGAASKGRYASRGEEYDKAVSQSYYDMVLSGKPRQAVHRATYKEGGGCPLPDDQCTKTS